MKKLLAVSLGLGLVAVAVSGCSTMTESPKERLHTLGKVEQYNAMQFNEAFDYFWLVDSPSRLSKWMVR